MPIPIELMMGVIAMVYIVAVREGLLSHKVNPIPLKKYSNGKIYLSISIFRVGLAILQTIFTKINKLAEYIVNQLKANIEGSSGGAQNLILIKSV